ncbi:Gfo/Idh/MocA family oxidoreductase [Roseateles sp. SL47]|uniref:Gfo/Idh/MocA family protein n=1 Tax=Roseateles sp. SL47 TaxID=2995138 RepID=UPI002271AE88|nr:Gfo/Idh/MocA family oxidoreductase [Roseateles sp. SL47]WAC74113.1 Gfo/Idh/MocA family oxidoreductase [Roseateles sp. SL47]
MTSTFQWALIGPGAIAHVFADAVRHLDGCRLHAVCGRDSHRAEQFAQRWSEPGEPALRVTTDPAALLADPEVDGVYIATPHGQHFDYARAALKAGKAVLCEKSLVPTEAMARTLVETAQAQGVFLMEAVWTRFLPVYQEIARWLQQGRIGQLRALQSSFCFPAPYNPDSRLFSPALAGGALLDVGVYNLNATRFVLRHALGEVPELRALEAHGVLAPTGVDARVSASLDFGDGLVAQFVCGIDTFAPNTLQVMGDAGAIVLPETFWQATRAQWLRPSNPAETVDLPFKTNGFEYQIAEAMRCIRAGEIESPGMPHSETLAVLGWIDRIRDKVGARLPFDAPSEAL